ncbi:MAG: 2Fe-2S iron-sulfur cluster-binding protein [Desulfobacca sp.]|nr:2Fe-2S iron-sulfur cluster-binding protein [Desulfobacca sp.]
MIHLTVNERPVTVPAGARLLQAVRAAGVALPTLCYHEGLAPYGACRLCLVTLTSPPPAKLVAACVHPAVAGMIVNTETPEAVASRRLAVELLLSRCPQSEVIKNLAAAMGVRESRFPVSPPEGEMDLCVLCGLCVRVCQEAIGANAIGFVGRGGNRKVSTPFELHSEACLGCGACAEICPTGAIRLENRGPVRILYTWHTRVELHPCPQCGRFFAPQAMAFLPQKFPEIDSLWRLCPECRQQRAARQWVQQQPLDRTGTRSD